MLVPPFYFKDSCALFLGRRAKTEVFGDADVDNFFDWSHPSRDYFPKVNKPVYVSCMYISVSLNCFVLF